MNLLSESVINLVCILVGVGMNFRPLSRREICDDVSL